MKKIFCIALMLSIAFISNSQTKDQPRSKTFLAAFTGFNVEKENTTGFEFGRWGTTSAFSYSALVEFYSNKTTGKTETWFGPKLYYTAHEKENHSLMIYANPKFNSNADYLVIENGLCFNINLPNNRIFGSYLGLASSRGYTLAPSVGI